MDHIDQAIYAVVHDSAIPAREIAKRLGMSYQVLINKANAQSEFHKLTLREAVAIQLMTNNHRIQEAIDVELSGGDEELGRIKGLLESVIQASCEHGDVVKAINHAIEDGRFTLRERENCQQEISEAIQSLKSLQKAIVEHGK
jgi:hypothetical protein